MNFMSYNEKVVRRISVNVKFPAKTATQGTATFIAALSILGFLFDFSLVTSPLRHRFLINVFAMSSLQQLADLIGNLFMVLIPQTSVLRHRCEKKSSFFFHIGFFNLQASFLPVSLIGNSDDIRLFQKSPCFKCISSGSPGPTPIPYTVPRFMLNSPFLCSLNKQAFFIRVSVFG